MTKYYALLTNLGAAKLANAAALGTKLQITHMAVGDGGGTLPTPNASQTVLIAEKRRAAINALSVDAVNSSQIIAEQIIPESEGGFWIREIGLFDADGVMIAVANCPETYKPQLQEGSGRTQTVRMILIVNSTDAVTLKIDPSVVLATRKYVDDGVIVVKAYADSLMLQHLAAGDPHPQYAPKASPVFSGIPTAPTPAAGNNSQQLANTAFVSAALAALTGSAPAALDTLNELAAAMGNDPNFSATVINALAGKMDIEKNGSDIQSVAEFLKNIGLSEIPGRLLNVQVFTSSGTYITTPGTKKRIVECLGAGAGGGGAQAGNGLASFGGGGGAGSYAKGMFTDQIDSCAVTIGSGGVGGGGTSNGTVGGTTSFGELISASGGLPGQTAAAGSGYWIIGGVGSPGTVTGGNIISAPAQNTGGLGFRLSASVCTAGLGADSLYGRGGDGASSTNRAGRAATGYGAGGAGGRAISDPGVPYVGGNGSDGLVIVWEYA